MLNRWLAQALVSFRAGPVADGKTAAVVAIGNDAGDLDSLVSSIAMADWQPVGGCGNWPLWVPVAPFARADFRLRQDACLLFRHVGLEFDNTIGAPTSMQFLDSVDAEESACWRDAGGLGMALVDHNACTADVAALFGERVVAIIDHHNDEQRHIDPTPPDPPDTLSAMVAASPQLRIIEPKVGSTCSLLAELMDGAGAGGGLSSRSGELCVLLLSAIAGASLALRPNNCLPTSNAQAPMAAISNPAAVDTRGFDPKLLGVKYAAADVRAAQKLYTALGAGVPRRLPPINRPGVSLAPPQRRSPRLNPSRAIAPHTPSLNGLTWPSMTFSDRLPLIIGTNTRPGSEGHELVLEAILALRDVELPDAARVGGASSISELSDTLLAARYDVRALSTLELMRWDYKEGVRAARIGGGQMAVGIAAICETRDELVARSGGARGLQDDMAAAAERRGGLDVLFALTKEDAAGGRKALVALCPADASGGAEAEALLDALAGVPTLTDALATNGLFEAQGIAEEGFGIQWEAVAGAPRLRTTSLREVITRKTLMPATLQL